MRRALVLLVCVLLSTTAIEGQIKSPEEFLGHKIGEDRFLAAWPDVVNYFEHLAGESDRIAIENTGETTLGGDIPLVVITSEDNLANIDHYRDISRQLANGDQLSPQQAETLIAQGKAVVIVTCSIHSSEVGSTQMSMEFAHDLATTDDPEKLGWLDQVILLVMPSINPDGQVMVVDWYNKMLGTEFEGTNMPWLYHHYVGHDNNRDFYMLTQKETRAVNRVLYHEWFPQIFVDEHQMGSYGPRMFVPPQADPLALEVNSLIFRQADLLGTSMAVRLEENGKTGVGSNMIFDSYWPGGTRNTAWWKNVTGLLTEVASARYASPVYVDPGELRGGGKGLPEYQRRANFPSPWKGGWWRLRDIVEYELVATYAVLETAALHREKFLRNVYRMSSEATQKGRHSAPYAFAIPPNQHDPVAAGLLAELMLEHGIRIEAASSTFTNGLLSLPAGTVVIPADQPYREFLMTMLRPQRYPEVRADSKGPILAPYDATSWSLPILMGVDVVELKEPVSAELAELEGYPWPKSTVKDAPGGWLLPRSADSVFTAVNRLTKDEREIRVLLEGNDHASAGDIYLSPDSIDPVRLGQLADDLHLPVVHLDERPSVASAAQRGVRVGLFKPWRASMDEGWTRFLFDRYEFDSSSLANEDLSSGDFASKVDVVVLPDLEKSIIIKGEPGAAARRWSTPLPPEYAGGIGTEGVEHLVSWVEQGGTLVALNRSAAFAIEKFELPVTNVLEKVSKTEYSAPGTMVRLLVDSSHPLGFGMRAEEAGYLRRSPAFSTRIPRPNRSRTVVARYPDDRRDVLVSGFLSGEKHLARRAAVVEVGIGDGKVVLIGFRAQNRAQPHRTFKLLFNALLSAGLELPEPEKQD
ncbi:MAG: hypothetical protein GY906_25955 [bacterium]|nr:hypothetical protein [bacterium]